MTRTDRQIDQKGSADTEWAVKPAETGACARPDWSVFLCAIETRGSKQL